MHPYPNPRTRKHNLVSKLPGPKGIAQNINTPIQA